MHTVGGNSQGLRIVFGSKRLTLHLGICPKRTLQTALAIGSCTFGCHVTLHYLVVGQVTTRQINQFLLFLLKTVENGYGMVGRTVVVSPHHGFIVGIRTDNGYLLLIFLQRQDIVVVLKQHYRLACHVERQLG